MKANLKILLVVLALVALTTGLLRKQAEPLRPSLPLPENEIQLKLLQIGSSETFDFQKLVEEVEQTLGRDVDVINPFLFPESEFEQAFDRDRGQWDAEKILPHLHAPAGTVVIAIFPESLYTSQVPEWRYCFGVHSQGKAVLSPSDMNPVSYGGAETPRAVQDRITKMTLRYILEMAYKLDRKQDPGSLLHNSVLGPGDLDRMEYRL